MCQFLNAKYIFYIILREILRPQHFYNKLASEHTLMCVLRGSSIFWVNVNLEYLL